MAKMYTIARKLIVVTLIIIYFGIIKTDARKSAPVLVEDDGIRRRTQPAGKQKNKKKLFF